MDDMERLAERLLEIKGQIGALEQAAGLVRTELEAKVAVRRDVDPGVKKWVFSAAEVIFVEPAVRLTLDRALLVQNGVSAEVLEKSTTSRPVKGFLRVERR